jgi:hypothetical protein
MVLILSTTSATFGVDSRAALQLRNRNRTYEERFQQLGNRDARVYASEAFKRGYERGRQYLERSESTLAKHREGGTSKNRRNSP